VARCGHTYEQMPAKAITASSSLKLAASRPRSTTTPWPWWRFVLTEASLLAKSEFAKSKVSCRISDRGVPATSYCQSRPTSAVRLRYTFDLDNSGSDVLDFPRSKVDDVLSCVESFPNHGAGHLRGQLVREGERTGGGAA
jgi:hypothetical protein